MVFYFSGTGNSQHVAVRLAHLLADVEAVSINRQLKSGASGSFESKRPLVFVAPTYCWRMPVVVERWIGETDFRGSRDAYFILTCAGGCGNAAAYAETLCDKAKLRFRGLATVVMPENYLAVFPTPGEAECRTIVEHAQPRIAALSELIRSGESFPHQPASLGGKLQSGPVNPLFYALFVHDKGFSVSDHCVSCGKCALRCPLNNIALSEGKPAWRGNCTHCMACIAGCPTKAIEYRSKTEGRHRHYIMNDALCMGNGGTGD